MAKLSGGDAIAQELKYHRAFLTDLCNSERSHLRGLEKQSSQSEPEPDIFPLVLSELVSYIVETSLSSDGPVVFHLADMSKLYQQRLEQLGVNSPTVNSTRLKEKLLAEIPELEAHKQGRDVLLAFQVDAGLALSLKLLNTQRHLSWPRLQKS